MGTEVLWPWSWRPDTGFTGSSGSYVFDGRSWGLISAPSTAGCMPELDGIRGGGRESRLSSLCRVINDRGRPLVKWLGSRVFLVVPRFFISLTRARR